MRELTDLAAIRARLDNRYHIANAVHPLNDSERASLAIADCAALLAALDVKERVTQDALRMWEQQWREAQVALDRLAGVTVEEVAQAMRPEHLHPVPTLEWRHKAAAVLALIRARVASPERPPQPFTAEEFTPE